MDSFDLELYRNLAGFGKSALGPVKAIGKGLGLLGVGIGISAGCATAQRPVEMANGLEPVPQPPGIEDARPVEPKEHHEIRDGIQNGRVSQEVYRNSAGDIESFTVVGGELDGAKGEVAVGRARGFHREGIKIKSKPGDILPFSWTVRGYRSGKVSTGEVGEGARIYLDGIGPGFVLDGRAEQARTDDGEVGLVDSAVGYKAGSLLVKLGHANYGGESLGRAWAFFEDDLGTGSYWVLAGSDNFNNGGHLLKGMGGFHPTVKGEGDFLRLIGDYNTETGNWGASLLYANGCLSPSFGLFNDRSNGIVEVRKDVSDPTEYRVKPLIEDDARSDTFVANGFYRREKGKSKWELWAIAYPTGVLDLKAGALDGLYAGALVRDFVDGMQYGGQVGFRTGPLHFNVEKVESEHAAAMLRLEFNW